MSKESGKNGRNGLSARHLVVKDPEFELVLAPFMGSAKEVLQKLVFATERVVQVNTLCLVRCSIPHPNHHRDFNQMHF